MAYTHIIFDVDGTLIDTKYAVLHSLQDTLVEILQKKIPISELMCGYVMTSENAFAQLGVTHVAEAIELWNTKMKDYEDHICLFDGIGILIESLYQAGFHLGIVTSRSQEEYEIDAQRLDIEKYFEVVICSDHTKLHKPHAEPLLKCIELMNVDKENVLYVGDSEYDRLCASSSHVDFALATWSLQEPYDLAKYYLFKPQDLIDLLTNQSQ